MQSNESKEEVPLLERLQDELDILNADIKDLQEKARECRGAINQLKKKGFHY